jgi:uncharacterized delta-60 repeat protein
MMTISFGILNRPWTWCVAALVGVAACGEAAPATDPPTAAVNSAQFAEDGFNASLPRPPSVLAVQPDDRILVGWKALVGGGLARLNADGTPDSTFNVSQIGPSSLALQADGKIVVAYPDPNGGSAGAPSDIVRLNADGTFDGGFQPFSALELDVVAVQPDGKIVVTTRSEATASVARLNADGTLDTTFSTTLAVDRLTTAVRQQDGKILVAGWMRNGNAIVRLNVDGTFDATFTTAMVSGGLVLALAPQPDGKIVVGGDFSKLNGVAQAYLGRLNADGTTDATFSASTGAEVGTILVQASGRILVGGEFSYLNGRLSRFLGRLNPDGTFDPTFRAATDDYVSHLAEHAGGAVIVGGDFGRLNGQAHRYIGRLTEDTWDLERDFEIANKPGNAWSYGWQASPGGAFTPYSWHGAAFEGVPMWGKAAGALPGVWKNTTPYSLYGAAPGYVSLHPGPSGEYSVVRWTAPRAMAVIATVNFLWGDVGLMDYYVYFNGVQCFQVQDAGWDEAFDDWFVVQPGDTIDFVVGGGYYYGNTPAELMVEEWWNIEDEYERANTPGGAWTFGWRPNASSSATFKPFSWNGPRWYADVWANSSYTEPLAVWNTTGYYLYGAAPGWVALHPGPNQEYAVLRWKAPTAADVEVGAWFGAGDAPPASWGDEAAKLDYYVQLNGVNQAHLRSKGEFATTLNMAVNAGDTIDFMVGGGYYYGMTPVSASVRKRFVP